LSPAEQKWVQPLLHIWNVQNSSLKKVIPQASVEGALTAGEQPHNLALTKTLAALIDCKTPKDKIKLAGTAPTARLAGFRTQLNAACVHNYNGAVDFAKAIGAVTKKNTSSATTYLKAGIDEFKQGTLALAKAYNAMVTLAGKNIFAA
jgi:hypothetical protein